MRQFIKLIIQIHINRKKVQTMKVGIVGYGNLGRGVEAAVQLAGDMELTAVFTRRDPETVQIASDAPVVAMEKLTI